LGEKYGAMYIYVALVLPGLMADRLVIQQAGWQTKYCKFRNFKKIFNR